MIPTSFKLGGHTWRVRMCKMRGAYGECDSEKHTIRIATHVDGRLTTIDTQIKTFLHEWHHAFEAATGQEHNEERTRLFEEMAWQTIKTSKGNQIEYQI